MTVSSARGRWCQAASGGGPPQHHPALPDTGGRHRRAGRALRPHAAGEGNGVGEQGADARLVGAQEPVMVLEGGERRVERPDLVPRLTADGQPTQTPELSDRLIAGEVVVSEQCRGLRLEPGPPQYGRCFGVRSQQGEVTPAALAWPEVIGVAEGNKRSGGGVDAEVSGGG